MLPERLDPNLLALLYCLFFADPSLTGLTKKKGTVHETGIWEYNFSITDIQSNRQISAENRLFNFYRSFCPTDSDIYVCTNIHINLVSISNYCSCKSEAVAFVVVIAIVVVVAIWLVKFLCC